MLRLLHPSQSTRLGLTSSNVPLTIASRAFGRAQLHATPYSRQVDDPFRNPNLAKSDKEESTGTSVSEESSESTPKDTASSREAPEEVGRPETKPAGNNASTPRVDKEKGPTTNSFSLPKSLDEIPWLRNTPSTLNLANRLDRWKDPLDKLSHLARELRQDPGGVMSRLGRQINEYTGYNAIEALKGAVLDAEKNFYKTREDLETSKAKYEETIQVRAEGQRELNGLLQRKSSWTDEDLTRFTALYREEHAYEAAETAARTAHRTAEAAVEQSYTHLVDAIRVRYHEEQVWSDRIRAASTYGTWALMGIHVLLFLVVQSIVEPRKRRKLAERLEASLTEQRHAEEAVLSRRLEALEQSLLVREAQMDRVEQGVQGLSTSSSALSTSLSAWVTSQAFPILDGRYDPAVSMEKDVEEEDRLKDQLDTSNGPKTQDSSSRQPLSNPNFMERHTPQWAREVTPWQLSLTSAAVGGLASLCLSLLCSR